MSTTSPKVSCIVPVFNEENYISATLSALRTISDIDEIIVVDDGSEDRSPNIAKKWSNRVICHGNNRGKGASLYTGMQAAQGEFMLFIDGDLGLSAKHAGALVRPLRNNQAEMAVAVLPPARKKAGVGLVRKMASTGIHKLTGYLPKAPLSGQRAIHRKAAETITSWDCGFGIEVGMTIDILRAGYRVYELDIPFSHRETGRDWQGWLHRGKQFWSVGQILQGKWRTGHE